MVNTPQGAKTFNGGLIGFVGYIGDLVKHPISVEQFIAQGKRLRRRGRIFAEQEFLDEQRENWFGKSDDKFVRLRILSRSGATSETARHDKISSSTVVCRFCISVRKSLRTVTLRRCDRTDAKCLRRQPSNRWLSSFLQKLLENLDGCSR